MVVWDMRLEQQELIFGDAFIGLYMIQSDFVSPVRDAEHSHSYYEIHLIRQGCYGFSVDGGTVPVQSGEMLIVASDVSHKAMTPSDEIKRCVLALTVKKRPEGDPVYGGLIRCLNAHTKSAIALPIKLQEKIDEYTHIPAGGGAAALLHRKLDACEIVVGLFDALGIGAEGTVSSGYVDFDIALEALVQNSDASLRQIAKELGYSERQMSRKIVSRYGKTFTQLRREKT